MASPQIGRVESKGYYSWLRGYHAYKGIFKPVIGTTLTLQREPENAKDLHAVAIVEDTGRVVGHSFIENRVVFIKKGYNHKATAEICAKRINRGSGWGLELPVIFKWQKIFGQTGRRSGNRPKKTKTVSKSRKIRLDQYVCKYSKMLLGARYNERQNI